MGFRGGAGSTSRVELASLAEVQSELSLSDEAKQLVETLNDEMREQRRELFQGGGGFGDFAAMREKMQTIENDATAKLTEKLTEEQNGRLTEVYVQVNGANALSDQQVQSKLSLTEEQTKKLDDAREENAQAMRDFFQDMQDMSRDERRQASEEMREEGEERLLAVLTDEQRTSFEQMKGETLEIDMSQLRRGFGRGGQGGFGGGRRGQDGDRDDRPERPE
jgi:hypothetical protein